MLCNACGKDIFGNQNYCGACGACVAEPASLQKKPGEVDTSWGILALNLVGMLLIALMTYPIRSELEGGSAFGYLLVRIGVPVFFAAVVVGFFFIFRRNKEKSRVRRSFIIACWVFLGLVVLGERSGTTQAPVRQMEARPSTPQPTQQSASHEAPYESRAWSGNVFDQYDSVQAIEAKARSIPQLNEQRAWAAVIAWQASFMGFGGKDANVALYMGVDSVLEGLKSNRGVCRPGEIITVDPTHASQAIPAGSQLVAEVCDRSP